MRPFLFRELWFLLQEKTGIVTLNSGCFLLMGNRNCLTIINDVTVLYGTLREVNQKKSEAMIENQLVMIQKENLQEHTKKLEQLNAELDRFAYVVSHDLKAPLRGIRNLVEFIQEDLGR